MLACHVSVDCMRHTYPLLQWLEASQRGVELVEVELTDAVLHRQVQRQAHSLTPTRPRQETSQWERGVRRGVGGWESVLLGGLEARLLVAQARDEVLTHLHHTPHIDGPQGQSVPTKWTPHTLCVWNGFEWFELWVVISMTDCFQSIYLNGLNCVCRTSMTAAACSYLRRCGLMRWRQYTLHASKA